METGFRHIIPLTSLTSGTGTAIVHDVYSFTLQIANVCFIGDPEQPENWLLVDAGMPQSASTIVIEAENRFGLSARPRAILLTHGHFDHVGALPDLIRHWHVPVYAHPEEIPYLNGTKNYPPGEATAGGGLVSILSPFFPNHGIQLNDEVHPLPAHGQVPFATQWQWLHTPGHTPGHVSFYRPSDGTLVAGDAFITVKQESLFHVLVQDISFHGPPSYFTMDRQLAAESVSQLAALDLQYAVTGHGKPVSGEVLRGGLSDLADRLNFIKGATDGELH